MIKFVMWPFCTCFNSKHCSSADVGAETSYSWWWVVLFLLRDAKQAGRVTIYVLYVKSDTGRIEIITIILII